MLEALPGRPPLDETLAAFEAFAAVGGLAVAFAAASSSASLTSNP